MRYLRPLILCAAPVLLGAAGSEPLSESFDVSVPQAPQIVATNGEKAVRYEIHLTNFAATPLAVRGILVTDADTGKTLRSFSRRPLQANLIPLTGAKDDPGAARVTIQPGARAVLYVELTGPVPRRIGHTVDYIAACETCPLRLEIPTIMVNQTAPVTLAPPLAAGPWAAVQSPDWPRGHRRVVYTLDGKARIPGRYAIDWVGLDDAGRTSRGDPDRPAETIGYDAPVLAGADARVAAVRDGMVESASIARNPDHVLGDGSGNYVALDLGQGRYAFYEHLRPGSIAVKVGQRVRRGQAIGALGFSGDTTGPHLHLHVADSLDPLKAEGIPFVIDAYTEIGRYDDIGALGSKPWQSTGPTRKSREWPASNVVVHFR
ncbi:M23 family metallopeptidase [Sphingomonas sp.]|uniref:M23 family metallopeptidase n=1 Tax=Sphingomonas sp. TaxID=28214 RepID=UPI003D6CFADF